MSEKRSIIFSHRRAAGDALMFTAGIRDFKLLFPEITINVDSNQSALWENNPYIDSTLKKGEEVEFYQVGYPMIKTCNNINMHFTSMFLFDMIANADLYKPLPISLGEFCASYSNGDVGDPSLGNKKKNGVAKEPFISLFNKYDKFGDKFSRQRGDIHLSEKEKTYNLIRDVYGAEKFWVIAPGGKRDCTAKIWDWRRFQEVIDYFDGLIKFVVIGKSDLLQEKLRNVIDLTDKFNNDLRSLISVVYHSDGCVSGPSFLMHLAAAIPPKKDRSRKPCVSIFGGREPSSWSWYCNHQILHTNGVFDCCDSGGCWKARTYPMSKDPKHNESLCSHTVKVDDRTVQQCMDTITSEDVIRAIEKYYEGNIYSYAKQSKNKVNVLQNDPVIEFLEKPKREINFLGNLNSKGGGEQSLLCLKKTFENRSWKVHLYPWDTVNEDFQNEDVEQYSFKSGMTQNMKKGLPLLFYGNDCVWDFAKFAQEVVNNSSSVVIGINFANGAIPRCEWLSNTKKLKAVVFQNEEKRKEFNRDVIGFGDTNRVVLFGAINLDELLEVCPEPKNKELVVLKHCVADYRKYTTKESVNNGEKIHIWQKHLAKELDTRFYERLLKDTENIRFEFMEAHKELIEHFKDNSRMKFYKWNEISVKDFLKRGHIYLYRTSNMWRDNYPRVVAEALAVGIPVISEPRDGTKDRIIHGDTGYYATHYDEFLLHLKTLQRKENFRQHLSRNAKDWARENLNPNKWVDCLEEILV